VRIDIEGNTPIATSGVVTAGDGPASGEGGEHIGGGSLGESDLVEDELGDPDLSENELAQLAELALSAGLDAPIDPDAVPLQLSPTVAGTHLPAWYMPAVAIRHSTGTKRAVIVSIVVALLVLEALGLCSVFGQVVIG
jgi:hypothetical protein